MPDKSTPGAMRATMEITKRINTFAKENFDLMYPLTLEIAAIIDEETGVAELVEALEEIRGVTVGFLKFTSPGPGPGIGKIDIIALAALAKHGGK